MADTTPDSRSALVLLRQFKELEAIRRQLIKQGHLDDDANPRETIEAIRKLIPLDLFGDRAPPVH